MMSALLRPRRDTEGNLPSVHPLMPCACVVETRQLDSCTMTIAVRRRRGSLAVPALFGAAVALSAALRMYALAGCASALALAVHLATRPPPSETLTLIRGVGVQPDGGRPFVPLSLLRGVAVVEAFRFYGIVQFVAFVLKGTPPSICLAFEVRSKCFPSVRLLWLSKRLPPSQSRTALAVANGPDGGHIQLRPLVSASPRCCGCTVLPVEQVGTSTFSPRRNKAVFSVWPAPRTSSDGILGM
jgi:hypothetical protein